MAREMKDSGVEWIGEIPKEWKAQKSKYYIKSCDGGIWGDDAEGTDEDVIILRSTEQNVDGTWCITSPAKRNVKSIPQLKSYLLHEGDLLITKSSGSPMHIGKTSIVTREIESLACSYSNFMQRIITTEQLLPRLAWYYFNSDIVRNQFNFMSNTTSGINNINAAMINALWLPVVPYNEQIRIADFLDRECGEIDAVLEKTRASVEEYKKLKQAVITQAVTKGIRPNRPMKDSGIAWIGQIPEDWKVISFKYVMHKEKNICEHYTGEDIISLTMGGVIKRDLSAGGKMPASFDGYQYVKPGDLLLCLFDIDVTPRCVGLVKDNGVTSPAYSCFKLHTGFVNTYYDYLLRFIDDKKVFVHLSKNLRSSLTESDFGALKSIVPESVSEQQEIADYLDTKCAELDALIAKKQQFLTELETYKKSLIYEYVTGKKEV